MHLDIKADNVCIPYAPADFDPARDRRHRLHPIFDAARADRLRVLAGLAASGSATALPIGWQKDYDYQSPRLLQALEAGRRGDLRPTRELDWRCDLYSLAAMLKRYLPNEEWAGPKEARPAGPRALRRRPFVDLPPARMP